MDELLGMGFPEETSRLAFQQSRGDIEQAITLLLEGFDVSTIPQQPSSLSPAHTAVGSSLMERSRGSTAVVNLDISQYSFGAGGTSACTSISCAMSLTLLSLIEKNEKSPRQTLDCIAELNESLFNGCSYHAIAEANNPYHDGNHMNVEDIYALLSDQLQQYLTIISDFPQQGVFTSDKKHFTHFLTNIRALGDPKLSIAVVITKPPETICIILPAIGKECNGYLMFDSHSRPQLGSDNAYLVHHSDYDDLIDRLNELFPALPRDTTSYSGGYDASNYLAALYEQFEGTPFQLKA